MNSLRFLSCLGLLLVVGCAKTTVTEISETQPKRLPRPDNIYVYSFAADYEALQPWSNARARLEESDVPPTPEQIKLGRQIGDLVAKELAEEIKGMGLSAFAADEHSSPRTNDIMLTGYFGTMRKGARADRMIIGFGRGNAELVTAVEGYQMTVRGPHLIGTAELRAGGGGTPGMIAPITVYAITSNPIGIAVVGASKIHGEVTGRSGIEGNAKRTAKEIGVQLQERWRKQGWIQ